MTKDYYKILGVAEFDSAENIKNAYRKLARKWHPDVAGSSKEVMQKFKEINEAYEILSNRVKKAEYDKAKRFYDYANKTSGSHVNNEFTNKTTSNPQKERKTFDFSWDEFWNNNKNKNIKREEVNLPKKGDDINSEIEISLLEAITGVTKTINLLQTIVCKKCGGKKFVNGGLCKECQGKGEHVNYKKFNVRIPAGIKNGSKIRLAGEGEKGVNGGRDGDLYITVKVKDTSNFKIEGLNILRTIPITPYEAVLGANIIIKTLNGNLNIKIAKNSQNGQKIRLANCGIVQNGKVGDMIVTLEIRIPNNLTLEEIELYRKLEKISSSNIRENF